ncbi:hypothetical protein KAR48_02610 [bacterium]|nr:hypothetical protein [bacterium]
MSFFNSGTFWFIEGILCCLAATGFKYWMEDRGVKLTWWKWGLVTLWIAFTGFVLAFIGVSIGENEMQAAQMAALIFGLIAVIAAVIVWRLLHLKDKNTANSKT